MFPAAIRRAGVTQKVSDPASDNAALVYSCVHFWKAVLRAAPKSILPSSPAAANLCADVLLGVL